MPAPHVQPSDLVEHTARPRHAWLRHWLRHASAAALAGGLGLGPAPAAEPAQEFEFDLPPGPLDITLLHIGELSRTIVSFQPAAVEQRHAPSIQGRFTLLRALVLATQASGLAVEITPGGSATVLRLPSATAAAGSASLAAAADGGPAVEAGMVLPRVEILGAPRQADGLRSFRGWSATRSDTPLSELSQAVSVLTPDALSLLGSSSVLDAVSFVPGASAGLIPLGGVENAGLTGIVGRSMMVRGLSAPLALSGLRSISGGPPPDALFVERIEVPKGPSGVLDAIADFKGRGGLVNLLLKEAQPYEHATLTQALSSADHGTLRLSADVGNEWGAGAAWRVLGFASQSGRSVGGYENNGSGGLLGTVRVRGERLEASITLQAQRDRVTPLPAARGGRDSVDGTVGDFPPLRQPRPPPDANDRLLASSGFARLHARWALSPRWSLSLNSMAEASQGDTMRHQPLTPPQQRNARSLSVNAQLGLAGTLTHGAFKHRLLIALDAGAWRTVTDGVDRRDGLGLVVADIKEGKTALLLQEELSIGPLHLRAGLQRARTPLRDELRQRSATGEQVSLRIYEPVSALNWDAGLLVKLRPALSVYAGTQSTTDANMVLPGQEATDGSPQVPDGTPLPPSTTRQVQAGLRIGAGQLLSLTLEAFRLRQDNLKLFNTSTLIVPGRSSDGLELELAGRLGAATDVSLGFTFLHCTEYTLDGRRAATRCVQAPVRSLYLLSRIRLGDRLPPFSHLGVAFQAASPTRVGLPYFAPSPVVLPGGGQLDLSLGGAAGAWSVTASLRNVFDQRLFGVAGDTRYLPLLPGRTVGVVATYALP